MKNMRNLFLLLLFIIFWGANAVYAYDLVLPKEKKSIVNSKYAFFVGFLAPYLKFVLTGMPVLYPNCIAMSFELATYGLMSGLLFKIFNRLFTNKFVSLYSTLIPTMLIGRVVWGLATFILLLFDSSKTITFVQYLKSAFVYSLPGILLQLCFIPVIVYFLLKTSVFNNLIEESK